MSGPSRNTTQRRAIRGVLLSSPRPLTAEEIREAASAGSPGIGLATVYRAIGSLVDGGWLRTVVLPGGPTRYEVHDRSHRHYFKCQSCGLTYPVEGCPGDLEVLTPDGFRLEAHEIVLYGRCSRCAASARKA